MAISISLPCHGRLPFSPLFLGPSHSVVPLAVALTLVVILAIITLSFYIYKQNRGFFRRLAGVGNFYYPTTNFSTIHLEENILISDLEKND